MALELFGMTGTKLYITLLVALVVIVGGGYVITGASDDSFSLSEVDDDTLFKYIAGAVLISLLVLIVHIYTVEQKIKKN